LTSASTKTVRDSSRRGSTLSVRATVAWRTILASVSVLIACAAVCRAADDYQHQLEEYTGAVVKYEEEVNAYWTSIADKRRERVTKRLNSVPIGIDDYVLAQPPLYSGPPKPVDPAAPPEAPPARYVPVVADFVRAASEHFEFVPDRPRREIEYKRAYAQLAAAAGLTRDQVLRIYGIEAGGNGTYDVQAGLEEPKPGAHAISTALGYNQLLAANSIGLMADKGDDFIRALQTRAAAAPRDVQRRIERKIRILERIIAFCRSVPYAWSKHVALSQTPQGMAVHALLLDVDIGPMLQVQKLVNSVRFAQAKGHGSLNAVELEMMNLTGDGNGFDMITIPPAIRAQVPTANFFQRGGYERNPIADRNSTVEQLFAATAAVMDEEIKEPGARELAAVFPD
jgi:hypothetical protein